MLVHSYNMFILQNKPDFENIKVLGKEILRDLSLRWHIFKIIHNQWIKNILNMDYMYKF